ncbi:MAG: hypothetical protein AAF770_01670 [Bacteroidota bacterium]
MIGYLYITLFCFALAASKVLIGNMHYDKSLILFFSFGLSLLMYGSIALRKIVLLRKKIYKNINSVIAINLSTTAYWGFSYVLALQYIEAPLVLCIDLAAASVFTFFFLTPFKDYQRNIPTIVAIFCVIICMTIIAHYYQSKVNSQENIYIGAVFGILAGLGNSCLAIFSRRLFKKKFSVAEVISVRFVLPMLVAAAAVLAHKSWQGLQLVDYRNMILSGFLLSVLMVFFFQSSIQKLGPLVVSTLMPFTPIIAYFMQLYATGDSCNYSICGTILVCSIILVTMNTMMKKEKTRRWIRTNKVAFTQATQSQVR